MHSFENKPSNCKQHNKSNYVFHTVFHLKLLIRYCYIISFKLLMLYIIFQVNWCCALSWSYWCCTLSLNFLMLYIIFQVIDAIHYHSSYWCWTLSFKLLMLHIIFQVNSSCTLSFKLLMLSIIFQVIDSLHYLSSFELLILYITVSFKFLLMLCRIMYR